MNENLKAVLYMLRHDPTVVAGFALVGVAGFLFFHVLLQMDRVGLRSNAFFVPSKNWVVPAQYLKVRKKYGWSAWPVYLLWPCLVGGVVCLVVGLFRL
jgi:hypothetical protein